MAITPLRAALFGLLSGLLCWCSGIAAEETTGPAQTSDKATKSVAQHEDVLGAIRITEAWLEALAAFEQIPSLSTGFVVDQETIFRKSYGYANPRKKVAASADTIYSVCSISKLFTSVGVMQMRDQGKLNLHDPVVQHLPWFNIKQAHAQQGPTRIKGLMTHSSGLPRESDFPYWTDRQHPFPTREQMLTQLSQQQTLYGADSLFQYSNLGLTLAGEIVRHYAGTSYEAYVTAKILQPLGMADTRPLFPEALQGKQMAVGYSGLDRGLKRQRAKPFHTKAIAPAAGYTSTVNDLAKFASWNFRTLDGQANEVLAPNTLREMQRVHWVDPDWKTTWGLGFVVSQGEGGTEVGHSGGCPGFITNFVMVPKTKTAAIALTSAGDGPAHLATAAMLSTIGKAVKGAQGDGKTSGKTEAEESDKAASKTATKIDLADYAGNFGGTVWGGETLVRVWADQLAATRVPSDELVVAKLKHVSEDTFVRLTDEGEEREQWHFKRNKSGSVSALKIHGSVVPKLP